MRHDRLAIEGQDRSGSFPQGFQPDGVPSIFQACQQAGSTNLWFVRTFEPRVGGQPACALPRIHAERASRIGSDRDEQEAIISHCRGA
jgi:hypothetical protein